MHAQTRARCSLMREQALDIAHAVNQWLHKWMPASQPPTNVPPFRESGAQMWHHIDLDGVPGTVSLRLGTASDGESVCTGLAIDAPIGSITTSTLKKVLVSALVDAIVAEVPYGEDPVWSLIEKVDLSNGPVLIDATPHLPAVRAKRGGKSPSKDELQRVVDAYQEAKRSINRRRPIWAVAKQLNMDESTVHRWLKRADPPDRTHRSKKGSNDE